MTWGFQRLPLAIQAVLALLGLWAGIILILWLMAFIQGRGYEQPEINGEQIYRAEFAPEKLIAELGLSNNLQSCQLESGLNQSSKTTHYGLFRNNSSTFGRSGSYENCVWLKGTRFENNMVLLRQKISELSKNIYTPTSVWQTKNETQTQNWTTPDLKLGHSIRLSPKTNWLKISTDHNANTVLQQAIWDSPENRVSRIFSRLVFEIGSLLLPFVAFLLTIFWSMRVGQPRWLIVTLNIFTPLAFIAGALIWIAYQMALAGA